MMSRKETRELLISMASKGYDLVGVIFKDHAELDILLIHKDWAQYKFNEHFAQAMSDLPEKIKKHYMVTFETPTRHMYDNERNKDAPKHKILVDLGPYPEKNYWTRKGLSYYATLHVHRGVYKWVVTKKLGFFSYHLIKYYHGVKGLNAMATSFKWGNENP